MEWYNYGYMWYMYSYGRPYVQYFEGKSVALPYILCIDNPMSLESVEYINLCLVEFCSSLGQFGCMMKW